MRYLHCYAPNVLHLTQEVFNKYMYMYHVYSLKSFKTGKSPDMTEKLLTVT